MYLAIYAHTFLYTMSPPVYKYDTVIERKQSGEREAHEVKRGVE